MDRGPGGMIAEADGDRWYIFDSDGVACVFTVEQIRWLYQRAARPAPIALPDGSYANAPFHMTIKGEWVQRLDDSDVRLAEGVIDVKLLPGEELMIVTPKSMRVSG